MIFQSVYIMTTFIPYVCYMGLFCIFELIIGILTITKLCHSKATRNELKHLFILSFILAILMTIAVVVVLTFGIREMVTDAHIPDDVFIVCDFLFWFSYLCFFITLLATLVTRLYVTFQDSAMRMARNTLYLFGVIFVLLFLLSIAFAIVLAQQYSGDIFNESNILQHRMFVVIPFLCLYFIGSAAAIWLFVVNVLHLTTLQYRSGTLCNSSVSMNDITLNGRQQKILHLSAKYVSLFCVASLSTFISVVFSFGNRRFNRFIAIFLSVDLSVNLLCLYLQFAFASEHYRKCCCCWDSCCRAMVQRKAKRLILRESQRPQRRVRVASNAADSDEDIESDDGASNTDPLIGESQCEESVEM